MTTSNGSSNNSNEPFDLVRFANEQIWPNWRKNVEMQDRIYEDGVRKFLDLPKTPGISNSGNTEHNYGTNESGSAWKTILATGLITLLGVGVIGGGSAYIVSNMVRPSETIIKEKPVEKIIEKPGKTEVEDWKLGQPKVE